MSSIRNAAVVLTFLFVVDLSTSLARADDQTTPADLAMKIDALFRAAFEDGNLVGAQLVIGNREGVTHSVCLGSCRENGPAVNEQTRFCIGSCSKPLAALIMLRLADRGTLGLEDRIDRWLPSFSNPQLVDGGRANRPPTIRELLMHRGGVYSQKEKLSQKQTDAIRDFTTPLEESARKIAAEPLITNPGDRFAYSGAGYCILGRAAEIASDASFEELMQEWLCQPLKMQRTTFFPRDDPNVASPGSAEAISKRRINLPHLLRDKHEFPLIGGGVYSTATDLLRFSQAILSCGKDDKSSLFSQIVARQIWHRPEFENGYGFGWSHVLENGRTSRLAHNGRLNGCRAAIRVDRTKDLCIVAVWTLTKPGFDDAGIIQGIKSSLNAE